MGKIGVGVIGVGTFGENHARLYAQDHRTELVGICDLDEARARALADELSVPFATSNAEHLIMRDDVQAVSIATPDFAHRDLAMAAAKARKHILCEKPIATTTPEAREIVDAAQSAGVTLMVDFHNRFNPAFLQAKSVIDSGDIGKPQYLYVRLSDTIFVPTQMLSWAAKSSVAWFLGSHCVDLVRWLTGSEVTRVSARAGRRVLKARGIDTADYFVTALDLADGTLAVVENCWILGDRAPAVVDFRGEIVGSEGHINVQPFPHSVVTSADEESFKCYDVLAVQNVHGRLTGFAIEAIRHFVSVLAGEAALVVDGHDGLEATRVVCAVEESARVGSPCEITPTWP